MKRVSGLLLVALVASSAGIADAQPAVQGNVLVTFATGRTPETFKEVTGGGLKLVHTGTPGRVGTVYTMSAVEPAPITVKGIAGAASTFDTDLGPNVKRIAIEPVVMRAAKTTSGFLAGPPTFGTATFTFAGTTNAAQPWVAQYAAGQTSRRTITVNLKALGKTVRSYVLRDCVPVAYATTGSAVLVVQPATIEVSAPTGDRRGLFEWYSEVARGTPGTRDIAVTATEVRSGTELARYSTRRSIMTEMTFPLLDAASADNAIESFTFQPSQLEKYP